MTEQFANNASSTLNSSITSSVTTLTVASVTPFSAVGNFRIIIDNEIMLVTSISGNTFTVTRGVENTTVASHSSGATVTQILTAGAIQQFRADNVQIGPYASLPAAGKAGSLYLSNDGPFIFRDSGSTWQAYGLSRPYYIPVVATFSWVNQGSAVATDTTAGINLSCVADASDSAKMLVKAIPDATPYSCIFKMKGIFVDVNNSGYAVVWRDSGTGNFKSISYLYASGNIFISASKGQSNFINGNYVSISMSVIMEWFKFSDDGTNQTYSVSVDGVNWYQLYSHARNTDVTPNQVGFYINPRNSTWSTQVTLLSYQETSP